MNATVKIHYELHSKIYEISSFFQPKGSRGQQVGGVLPFFS